MRVVAPASLAWLLAAGCVGAPAEAPVVVEPVSESRSKVAPAPTDAGPVPESRPTLPALPKLPPPPESSYPVEVCGRKLKKGTRRIHNCSGKTLEGLSGLPELRFLDLRFIEGPVDLAPLAHLKQLRHLNLGGVRVTDLSAVAYLSELEELYAGSTRVSDLAPVAYLRNLRGLYLSDTRVKDLSPLAGLSRLMILDLSYTQIRDISPLTGLRPPRTRPLPHSGRRYFAGGPSDSSREPESERHRSDRSDPGCRAQPPQRDLARGDSDRRPDAAESLEVSAQRVPDSGQAQKVSSGAPGGDDGRSKLFRAVLTNQITAGSAWNSSHETACAKLAMT